jgi:ribosome-associated heat shock protein Hsp15
MSDQPPPTLRVDKWLWQARFFKTRGLAASVVKAGIRINATRIAKPSASVGPGDVLTFTAGSRVRVIRVVGLGLRRGPASEAQALYEDLSPGPPAADLSAPKPAGPRPDKRDRRRFAAPPSDWLE